MYGVAFVFWLCFVLRMNQDLMECCVWFLRCVDVVFFHCSLDTFRNSSHTAVSPFLCVLGYLFFFFLSPRVVPFLFLTWAAPLVIAHSGYWHLFSECCRCFSSCVLSSGSVIIVVRSCSALTTDNVWTVGCSDVQRRYW